MTVGGWIIFIFISLCVIIFAILLSIGFESKLASCVISVITICVIVGLFIGLSWYYNNTASGARAKKSQESNFNNGIEREVKVRNIFGDVVESYSGKFDVDYDSDRIIFDDENGKRHIIYYPTGIITIDEK